MVAEAETLRRHKGKGGKRRGKEREGRREESMNSLNGVNLTA